MVVPAADVKGVAKIAKGQVRPTGIGAGAGGNHNAVIAITCWRRAARASTDSLSHRVVVFGCQNNWPVSRGQAIDLVQNPQSRREVRVVFDDSSPFKYNRP